MKLIKYDAACRAIAEAKSIDEVQEIGNRAEAVRAYARQARNRSLELDAMEIRLRAERRLGEVLIALRKEKTFKLGRPRIIEDLGLNGNLASGAQRLALVQPKEFEHAIREWRDRNEAALVVPRPLQDIRNPSNFIHGQKRRAATRPIDGSDPLDQFRGLDARPFADHMVGELRTLEALTRRQLAAIVAIRSQLPANAEYLGSVRRAVGDDALFETLNAIWSDQAVPIMPNVLEVAGIPSARGGRRAGSGRKKWKRQLQPCGT
jgi:hypothetical protein